MDKKIINIVTLGCSKNLVDSEQLSAQLSRSGYVVEYNSTDTNARIVVINTCGFIGDAKEESIDTILRYANLKNMGEIDELFVFGCLAERYREDLRKEIEEVDNFFGVNDLKELVEKLNAKYEESNLHERMLSTPKHYAYLKIAEGCDWQCSYCAIPLIRGKHKSKSIEDIVLEANEIVAKGVKEVMLIAQDLTYYGIDMYGERKLAELLVELCKIEKLEWIRLHYAYPAHFPREVIEVMKNNPKICNYIDIPFQHANSAILKSMRRGITKEETYDLINFFRSEIPDIAIRTTLIAGYPTETEADFEELCDFVKECKFDRLGVFAYCHEEDTPCSRELEDVITDEEKQRRVDVIMTLQAQISLENNHKLVGTTQKVIIDRKEGEYFVGRSQYDSPEVDQEVLITSSKELICGDFYEVEITGFENYDIFAKC
ncbi:MAG: 30S ribosomal protein S12 methylthiotransferase RimO [Bacteroidetes bacterium]|nr:30S ribosomal protein S12 methylthiotransferase RimO [Bacteroidota bacterium]